MLRLILLILMTMGLTLSPLQANGLFLKPRAVYLTYKNTVVLDGEINPVSTDTFIKALIGARGMLPEKETLYVLVVSQGGQYYSGQLIKKTLQNMRNIQLICKYCASAAGEIFGTTGAGHKRLVIEKSIMLMHEMYMPHMTAEMSKNPAILKSLQRDSDEFNAAHYKTIGISKEEYEKKILNKEWTLYNTEIIKWKLADEFVTISCDSYMKNVAPDTCTPK